MVSEMTSFFCCGVGFRYPYSWLLKDVWVGTEWIMRDVLLGWWIIMCLNFKFVIGAYTGLYKRGYIG